MSKIGHGISLEIYGASHAECVGMRLSGISSGESINLAALQSFVDRRKSVDAEYSTTRGEPDKIIVKEGIVDGKTTGGDIVIEIKNITAKSADYDSLKHTPRPSHADYAARVKYGDSLDLAGGGSFSGRMTAPLCAAGGIAEQLLAAKGISVCAYVGEIGGVQGGSYKTQEITAAIVDSLKKSSFPVIGDEAREKMLAAIISAKDKGDSLGGVVEVVVTGLPAGLGDCLFDGAEGVIASYVFGIPAVKGLEFGAGFDLSRMTGSHANDEFYYEKDTVKTYSNNSGGINGGISNGMQITLRTAFRPTPSIAKPQRTVDLKTHENTIIEIKGRHDACIVPRAAVAVEAAVALAILDLTKE